MANNLKLAQVFRDNLVLRQNKPIRIFGKGFGNVTARLEKDDGSDLQYRTVKADEKGSWLITLDARTYGGPYTLTVTCGNESTEIHNVMIGEVILFSGQSNIQFHMSCEVTPQSEYVRDPMLRIFVSERLEKEELFTPADGWIGAVPEQIVGWSALAYLVGLEHRRAYPDIAVGVVACSQGASCIQSWIDETLFTGDDEALSFHQNPVEFYKLWNDPGRLYRYMLEPLMPMPISYVVWYQGECNTRPNEAENYGRMLELLTSCWRKGFMDDELRFCIVQLADHQKAGWPPLWKLVQQIQADAPSHIPHTVSVKCADICEDDNIHPPTKWKLAKRIFEAMNRPEN